MIIIIYIVILFIIPFLLSPIYVFLIFYMKILFKLYFNILSYIYLIPFSYLYKYENVRLYSDILIMGLYFFMTSIFLLTIKLAIKLRSYSEIFVKYALISIKYISLIFLFIYILYFFIFPFHLLIKKVSKDYKKEIENFYKKKIEDISVKEIREFITNEKEKINEQLNFIKINMTNQIELPILDIKGEILIDLDKDKLEILREYELKNKKNKNNKKKSLLRYVLPIDLSNRNFNFANLQQSVLINANLKNSKLFSANLNNANLSGADLSLANLSGADLKWANLSGANLSEANLFGADLKWANLSGADLSEANLSGADLFGAKLKGACSSWRCNEPLILRVGKKADLIGIQNETLTEEKIKKILELIKERVDEEDYKKWRALLYQFKGKRTLDWIKAQNVDLGVFTEEDYKEHIKSIASTEEDIKEFIKRERQELKRRKKWNTISQQEYEKYLNLLNKIEKEMIKEYKEFSF